MKNRRIEQVRIAQKADARKPTFPYKIAALIFLDPTMLPMMMVMDWTILIPTIVKTIIRLLHTV